MIRKYLTSALAASLLATAGPAPAAEEAPSPAVAAILQDLRSFRTTGTVLLVAAHPDDENTQLITYLARGRGYRMAYLSVTRGDGGQNVLGPEFGEELGVIRTQELLAARHLDGGRQFFTRAMDFGYSKDFAETLRIWDHEQVLADVVRVIREFRPDVVVTGFSPEPRNSPGQHGHHIASAMLAVEAFKRAGDSKAFPDQLATLKPWQPKRIFYNARFFGRGAEPAVSGLVRIDDGGNDPVTGESFASLAARSRAMHKTQGLGNLGGRGGPGGPHSEAFQLVGGDPATNDIMDGVDTTWSRIPGGAEIGPLADDVLAKFDAHNPSSSVPALLEIHAKLAKLPPDPLTDEKRRQLDRILQGCLGLTVETTLPSATVVPGETLKMVHTATVTASVPVRWMSIRYLSTGKAVGETIDLKPGQPATRSETQELPGKTLLTQPYWLREAPATGIFRVDDPSLIGQPENPPAFPIEQVFEVGGQTLVVPDEPVQLVAAASEPQARRRLDVIPPVSLDLEDKVQLLAPGTSGPAVVSVTANRPNAKGALRLEAPEGWKVLPARQSFSLSSAGSSAKLTFTVTAPKTAASADLLAVADVGGGHYSNRWIQISYSHVPPLLLQPPATLKALSLNLATRGHNIGYIPGAGDSVADAIREMGYAVTMLGDADLTTNRLRQFDAVVIGVRALDVHETLAGHMDDLFAYVEQGGTVVEQYYRPAGQGTPRLAPYDLRISNQRVTDETSQVTLLATNHPVLNSPNKITTADFDDWIQERSIYLPGQWDEHFVPILSCADPGESQLSGGLLVARYGQGYFVYTSLVFFRQLPAGVPGAFRLFANLVSLGK